MDLGSRTLARRITTIRYDKTIQTYTKDYMYGNDTYCTLYTVHVCKNTVIIYKYMQSTTTTSMTESQVNLQA